MVEEYSAEVGNFHKLRGRVKEGRLGGGVFCESIFHKVRVRGLDRWRSILRK